MPSSATVPPPAPTASISTLPPSSSAPSTKSSSTSKAPKPKPTPTPKEPKPKSAPGGNWAALKAKITPSGGSSNTQAKKRKWKESQGSVAAYVEGAGGVAGTEREDAGSKETSFKRGRVSNSAPSTSNPTSDLVPANLSSTAASIPARPQVLELRTMVLGSNDFVGTKAAPGRYLAIDCEMVGVGPEGAESSLARVSIVNFHGSVVLDTFVKQKEKVVDYRTWVSGVTVADLIGAPTFEEVQKQVADLIKEKVLVGHAIKNDFDALLLSHPRPLVRDTQTCPALRIAGGGSKHPGLKKLALVELGVEIQSGRHSSVVDARATMALYRLHKEEWEPTFAHLKTGPRRKGESFPGGGRRGVSSGLGMVVVGEGKKGKGADVEEEGGNWWDE